MYYESLGASIASWSITRCQHLLYRRRRRMPVRQSRLISILNVIPLTLLSFSNAAAFDARPLAMQRRSNPRL
ncbi:hypothetical protein BD310DRAFT_914884 [Dichomitus squalens]|uniref:Uncharacterized protein n=1 Tax=Dichomitus squalens TaxID=114155 RepID=A0A4Q9QA90_9APHY|nr:hypothetical protein BD310DRAFT_914884 [Dichomitus squalens]